MASVFTLNISGTMLAILFGLLVFVFGLNMWWYFIAVMVDFLVLSAIVTRAKDEEKEKLRGYEKERSWKNVVANGIVPVIMVFFYFLNARSPFTIQSILVYSFVAAMSAITADKFASELGVLDGEPVMLLTLKKAKKGMSGGVTWFGTLMGLIASILIALTVFAISAPVTAFIVIVVSGFVGNVVDSIFGYFEEKGIGNKFTSNILCSIAGSVFCAAVFLAVPSLL
ncbi:MAG: DUF92 domain-containing protein [Candidatus Micrarchaeota archaeon]|nr:DUF92 domain-containing protein [Candidatus Micrarchaeota archaeon]MDE1859517.1 DUF92 domain-containing protein [Candidatus Micrarchaeota archaeon]